MMAKKVDSEKDRTNKSSLDSNLYKVKEGFGGDVDEILRLINLVQPTTPWSREYLNWQYYQPSAGKPKIFTIFCNDRLVSLFVAVTKKIRINVHSKEGFMIQDVMTHPDHRGRGFLNKLTSICAKYMAEGEFFAYTFPNKQSENSFRRQGWTELCAIPLRGMEVPDEGTGGRLNKTNINFTAEQVYHFDQRSRNIWNDSELEIGCDRDESFMNWRYSRPNTKYDRFYINGDQGYLVLKLFNKEKGKVLHILDLVVCKSSRHLIQSILCFSKSFAIENGAQRITCWLDQRHPYATTFDKFGLTLDPKSNRFAFVMGPTEHMDRFSDISLWHLTQGDSDVY